MSVNLNAIKYLKVEGVPVEVNTVECDNLSPSTFLANNDLNITASCFHVNFGTADDKLFSIHASPQFWTILFQKHADRVIKPMNSTFNVDGQVFRCSRLDFLCAKLIL